MFDETNERSLINLVPDRLKPLLKAVRQRYPRLLLQPEKTLRTTIGPDDRDEKLRLSFWNEFNQATAQGRRMVLNNIIRNVVYSEVWNNFYEKRLDKLAWIICPPKNYTLSMQHILNRGVDRLMEIMNLPILKKDGTADTKAISQVLKAFQLVDLRVKGAIIQRVQIQQQSLNFNTDITTQEAKDHAAALAAMSLDQLEALDQKLSKLEKIEEKMVTALPAADQKEIMDIQAGTIGPLDEPLQDTPDIPDIPDEPTELGDVGLGKD